MAMRNLTLCLAAALFGCGVEQAPAPTLPTDLAPIGVEALPEPTIDGSVSLEQTLALRRSIRLYTGEPLTREQVSQLLWSAQGQTRDWGGKTAPSAGALYPIELFAVTPEGLYHYRSAEHSLELLSREDLRPKLVEPKFNPELIVVITGIYQRTEVKYGVRTERYVKLEAGHVAQNILLQAVALELGAVPIGAFDDRYVQQTLGLPEGFAPLYLIWAGHPAE
jgi:SagB-type dehydrogenase family enzyme